MKFYFDFEANQFTERIISVGCVSETGERYYSLVSHNTNKKEKITKFITELTGITQEDYDNAPKADYVFLSLSDWIMNLLPDINTKVEYFCYGDCDVRFIDRTVSHMKNFSAVTFLLSVRASIVDCGPIIAKHVGKTSIGLQRIYNFLKNETCEQNHSALEDAEMLKYVMDNVDKLEPTEDIPLAPEDKAKKFYPDAVTSFPTGKFFIRGTGKNSKEHEFEDIHAAMEWIINTRIKAEERANIRRDKMALKIMKAVRKKETYMQYLWRREKENVA